MTRRSKRIKKNAGEHQKEQRAAAEILRRSGGVDDLPDESLEEPAAELFRSYDLEEAAGADD